MSNMRGPTILGAWNDAVRHTNWLKYNLGKGSSPKIYILQTLSLIAFTPVRNYGFGQIPVAPYSTLIVADTIVSSMQCSLQYNRAHWKMLLPCKPTHCVTEMRWRRCLPALQTRWVIFCQTTICYTQHIYCILYMHKQGEWYSIKLLCACKWDVYAIWCVQYLYYVLYTR